MNDLRIGRRFIVCLFFFGASLLALALPTHPVLAQPAVEQPDSATPLLYLPLTLSNAQPAKTLEGARNQPPTGAVKLLVDTDPGIDDAVALVWLMTAQPPPELLGVVTVAGNASIYNTTNNALTILQTLGRQNTPVVMGAAAPLSRPLSKSSYFIHGPDGLWFLGWQNPQDLSNLPTDAPAFYCSTVAANPGAVLLALGPLTNVAQAVQQCPDNMRSLAALVILGGAKHGGNKTPVAEFNFWQDPEAASIVLGAGLPITLVPLDAFSQPVLTQPDLDKLFRQGNPAIQFLAPAIQQYTGVQIANSGRAVLPDVVAAAVALDSKVGLRQSALVRLVTDSMPARGQSIIALTTSERVSLIAGDAELDALAERAFSIPPDPSFDLAAALGAILWRAPDNAQVVLTVDDNLLTKTILPGLRAK